MGSVVTVCMFVGLVYAILRMRSGVTQRFPAFVHSVVGAIVLMAGAWNVFWYAIRNITHFWGKAALLSGITLILTGYYIVNKESCPLAINKLMPIVLLVLFGCMLLYGITIYRL